MVDEATGGGDEEVAALVVEAVALAIDVGTAEDHLRLEVMEGEQRFGLLVNLRGELAGGGEDEAGDGALSRGARPQEGLNGGEEESHRLSRSRLGARQNVEAVEDGGQRLVLNGGGVRGFPSPR